MHRFRYVPLDSAIAFVRRSACLVILLHAWGKVEEECWFIMCP